MLGAQPVRADDLSQGFVVETSVLARLLGIKLLTLEGVVFVSPARVVEPPAERARVVEPPTRTPISSAAGHRNSEAPDGDCVGARLGDAGKLLDECSAELRLLGQGSVGWSGDRGVQPSGR